MHVAHRDRAESRRDRGARYKTHIAIRREQSRPTLRDGSVDSKRDQLARHATVPAMQNADDDLLPDVAALAHRKRALFDASLERDRVVSHVDAEDGITSLDTRSLDRLV